MMGHLYTAIYFITFLAFAAISSTVFAEQNEAAPAERPDIQGVLVQVADKDALTTKPFQELLSQYSLEKIKFYPQMEIAYFDLKNNEKSDKKTLLDFCQKASAFESVKLCELNLKLKPNQLDSTHSGSNEVDSLVCLPQPSPFNLLTPFSDISDQLVTSYFCQLMTRHESPHERPTLSRYWAQEYTGADLLRERMEPYTVDEVSQYVHIWDTLRRSHGQKVSSLIASNPPSSAIPLADGNLLGFANLEFIQDYIEAYELTYDECHRNGRCPAYINNSMGWVNSQTVREAFRKMNQQFGTLGILSADNNGRRVETPKRESAQDLASILVSSLDFHGMPSDFTSFAPEVLIAAPSNNEITSYTFNDAVNFGGTSGAAPQVTSALTAFTLITGHRLTHQEATRLLERTSLPLPGLPRNSQVGRGMLNTYAIGEIALRIKDACSLHDEENQHTQCIQNLLADDSSYQFDDIDSLSLLTQARETFPQCYFEQSDVTTSCQTQRELFTQIRQYALLTQDPEFYQLLACLSEQDGYSDNAQFYQNIAQRLQESDDDLHQSVLDRVLGRGNDSRNEEDSNGRSLVRYLRLEGSNFSGQDLRDAFLESVYWEEADLSGADLTGADLRSSNFSSANLQAANLTNSSLRGANLSNANLFSANLTRANLVSSNLTNAQLSGTNLSNANLIGVNLRFANLTDANLTGADLRGVDLTGVNLTGADLTGARLPEGFDLEAHILP